MTQMVPEEAALGETCIYIRSFMIHYSNWWVRLAGLVFSPENLQVKNTSSEWLFQQILKIRSWDFPEPPQLQAGGSNLPEEPNVRAGAMVEVFPKLGRLCLCYLYFGGRFLSNLIW